MGVRATVISTAVQLPAIFGKSLPRNDIWPPRL
jgi:hypothetical protein